MQGEIVARSYASALFDLAESKGSAEAYGQALDEVGNLLDQEPAFGQFLETPRIDAREKKRLLRETFGGRIPEHVLNFLLLVVDKRRQKLLKLMAREYRDFVDKKMGRAHVEVTVARAVDGAAVADLKGRLSKALGKDVVPHVRVDPSLVGGIVVRSGDVLYDGSVRRRLQGLRRHLLSSSASAE
jgi:F-type H+-transporting ATPase subunit delta